MRNPTLIAAAVTLALSSAGFAHAQTRQDTNRDGKVSNTEKQDRNRDGSVSAKERRDENRDGKVTKKESAEFKKDFEARFKKLDTNDDGGLSRKELKGTKGFDSIEQNFTAMDTNSDGKVTMKERDAYVERQRDKRDAKKK
jgi:hypothetical protein